MAPKPLTAPVSTCPQVGAEQSATGWLWKLNQLRLAVFKALQLMAQGCKIVICG
jgi:hypothetical protein